MDQLSNLSAFVQAAETGSFVAAGRNLGLTASAIGKSVSRLEQRLGVRLFHRDTRNMTLTYEGQLFLGRCRRVFEELDAAEAELTRSVAEPSGRLRISMPLSFDFLMPLIAEFMANYPTVVLDLDLTDRVVELIDEGFDMVIRTGTFTDSTLMRRSLWRFGYVLAAAPSYLEANGRPGTPADLPSHRCLRQRTRRSNRLYEWEFEGTVPIIPETTTISELAPLIAMTVQGAGIAYFPHFAVRRQLHDGTLVPLLPGFVTKTETMSALWPPSRHLSPKVRAFVDFLAERLRGWGEDVSLA